MTMEERNDSEDISFDRMWENVAAEYQKTTSRQPLGIAPSIEQVLQHIRSREAGNEKSRDRTRKVKQVMDRVVELGNLAASGASIAFPPSQLCSTAIFYLIDTCWVYEAQKTDVEELFDKITPFLERYDIYLNAPEIQARIDVGLKKIINNLLRCFVRVCSRYTEVYQENPLERVAKALARYDSGVKDQLKEIERLQVEEERMRGTLIHKESLRTGLGVEDLQKKYAERSENEVMDRYQEIIKTALNIDDSQHSWHDTQRAIWNDITESTGKWLFDRDDLKDWENSQSPTAPSVLALEAGEGYGRAYLCAAVINHLQQQKPADPKIKRHVAYYYFQKDEKDRSSMRKALNAIIWQLSMDKSNKAFAQFFSRKCEASEHLSWSKTYELWENSIMAYAKQSQMSSQTFIVIDGIGHASEDFEELSRIVQDVSLFDDQNCSIRLLLTGADRDLNKLQHALDERGGARIVSITINRHNKSDLELFIQKRMEKISETWEPNSDNEEYQQHVVKELLKKTDGDYEKLNLTLIDIAQKAGKDEIDKILERAREPRKETIRREIDRLQKTLTEREIDTLNEILPWIVLPRYDWPTMSELKAVLFLKYGKRPLMSLQTLIREKYAPLLVVDGKLVRSYSTMKYFKNGEESQESQEPEPETPIVATNNFTGPAFGPLMDSSAHSPDCPVHETEIAMVKQFLVAVCDPKLFQRFGFKNFFDRLQSRSGNIVQFDLVDGHARIILACLKALCARDQRIKTEAEPLLDYAITHLRWHLSQITPDQLPLVKADKRKHIGKLLFSLFMDRESIENWMTSVGIQDVRHEWLYHPPKQNKNSLAEEVLTKWFKDPEVIGGIGADERERINTIIYGSKKPGDLFLEATKMVAGKWLASEDWDVTQTLWWILGLIQNRTERYSGNNSEPYRDLEKQSPPFEAILEAEAWAKTNGIGVDGHLMSDARLIDTLMQFRYTDKALNESVKRDASGWMRNWCTAREQYVQQDHNAVLESLSPVMQKFRSEPNLQQTLPGTWKEIIYLYGDAEEKRGHWKEALDAYLDLFTSLPSHPETAGRAIHCMKRLGKFSEIIELLEDWANTKSEKGATPLTTLFLSLSRSPVFHHEITFAARQGGRLGFIKDVYKDAVAAAEPGSDTLAYLRYYYGLALWYQQDRAREDAEKAINAWEENIFDSEIPSRTYILRITSFKLSSVYLQLAREYGFHTSAGWFYVTKLKNLVEQKSTEFQWTGSEEVLLARAYHLAGYKTKAKEIAAKHIGPAMDILYDKDLGNDWEGYTSLSNTLGHMDDDEDALAAKSLIGPLQREWGRTDSADDLAEIAYFRGRLKSSCDNLCGQRWKFATDMHICRDCIRTIFCGDCLKKLRNGAMEYRLCDKSHQFLEVRQFKPVPKDQVRVGTQVKSIVEWKESIKSRYNV